MRTFAAIWIATSLLAAPALGAGCEALRFEDTPFTVCRADPAADDIRLMLDDPSGTRVGTFARAEALMAAEGRTIAFAMNAGMYHPDRRPVGLYIEAGREVTGVVTREGPGNFGLLPNGVLCIADGAARIVETRAFAAAPPECTFATQSGPMLVIDGALHPRFLPRSTSRFVRNGVGVTEDGTLVAVISDAPVNFHRFARLFRDVLGTPNALFLDGSVSKLLAPELDRSNLGFPMGPMLVVTRPAD
ncbi:MAG: phosphodiester glycosidase family protein [Pseudomonadota bacterium]